METTLLGLIICFISATNILAIIMTLEILSPPAVDPAHAPKNISRRSTVCENTGHFPKSAVEKPVVVITDETVKNISLNACPIDL